MDKTIIPWHSTLWASIAALGPRLPHAMLLSGPAGVGKSQFAEALAKKLLCEAPTEDEMACGKCPACRWFAAESHPDFRHVCPESESEGEDEGGGERKRAASQIKIDQIRELDDFVFVGGHRGGRRVVVIEPAEAMNGGAANSLLKLLEEPPASVYFILVSSSVMRLLPTIRSRCRRFSFHRPSQQEGAQWLRTNGHGAAAEFLSLAGGAPMLAVQEADRGPLVNKFVDTLEDPGTDPLQLAARWEGLLKIEDGLSIEGLVTILQKWVFDLASFKLAGAGRFIGGRNRPLAALVERSTATGLIRCYNDLLRVRRLAGHPLNPRLLMEETAERYLRALATNRS
jgi:DNA polymerase-3 subunit delta'